MTVVIDNGTHTIKYGIAGTRPRTKENVLYKSKHNYSFTPSKDSYIKKMFVNNIPVNYDVLEGMLDCVFSELGITKVHDIVLTLGVCTPKVVKREIAELLIEVYNVHKLQLGIDSVYSYLHNVKQRNACDIVVSSSHSETHLVRMDRLDDVMALPYGGERARAYYNALLRPKNIRKTDFYVRVAQDYRREALAIYDRLRNRDLKGSYVLEERKSVEKAENMKMNVRKALEKKRLRRKEMEEGDICEEDEEIEEGNGEKDEENGEEDEENGEKDEENEEVEEDSNVHESGIDEENGNEEENEGENSNEVDNENGNAYADEEENGDDNNSALDLDEGASHVPQVNGPSLKKNRMVYYSAIYRNKQKIEKCLLAMRDSLTQLEERHFKMSEPEKYLQSIKERFFVVRARIEAKENLKRKLRNKRSRESALLSRATNMNENEQMFTQDEAQIIEQINEIDHEDSASEQKCSKLLNEIYALDPSFEFLDFSTVEIMNGDHMGLTLSNTESLRVGEAVFNPSIMNCALPGLSEMIESALQGIGRAHGSVNVFVTGGFSQIEGFFERVVAECTMNAYGGVKCIKANDPVLDAFYGASFCEYFPVISREMYREEGPERLF
ncbi:Actin-related protein - Arp5p [Trachipleistophora hominis]|uniref:Actin-related protein-Arp5p n=1 Tax=Trachipleistophora hominis TaxID=72359 RepID=L7JYI3_TRAHO|nr:Actin-related protein - Arp5p [Trachipleistophora hominis]